MRSLETLLQAAKTPAITERYWAKVRCFAELPCWFWIGAISGRGHGRFWVEGRTVVVAHRFGWLLRSGGEELPDVVRHACDNPLCQNPEHLLAGTWGDNRRDYLARVGVPGSALNDVRGSFGRALAIRDAARDGGDVAAVLETGKSRVDLDQPGLW